jgi:hypothetical protein
MLEEQCFLWSRSPVNYVYRLSLQLPLLYLSFFMGMKFGDLNKFNFTEISYVIFCKFIWHSKSSTPNCIVYGELGIFSLVLQVQARFLCFWSKNINAKEIKICKRLYKKQCYLCQKITLNKYWIICKRLYKNNVIFVL